MMPGLVPGIAIFGGVPVVFRSSLAAM